ncbi:Permease of the drug/metabolite transporter (DMT) superfamily [Psychrobacillus psychrotolerans]|uniref:Permease of the drug/metabolite transporter (DMT) superfamily n=1 Tax=Psychrobacillus psychrotolerans TaxID=126156 RepID=A0A1I5ZX95_9BACI|nr:DMT family transporter [Psychrobacillus psychrotolerans]SFQ60963.1 Permease of the drug/metabolite transporter (DMT) superfamily [Psychrobacillus psychrotolerans]
MFKYMGELLLVLTAIIWGSGFVASAVALEHYTPYQILAGRFLIGGVILSLIFFKKFNKLNKSTLIKGALLGLFLYIAFALQTVGLQFTTPSKNAFLTAVNVVIVPFIGFLLYKRKIDMYELTGAILAVVGIAVLSLKLSSDINVGDVLTLGCAVGFAFHIFYTAKFVKTEDPVVLTIVQMVTAAVIGCIVILFRGETSFSVESEGVLNLLYLGIFSTTIAFLMQTVAQKYITETKAAIILATESFWGMVFSIIILSEIMTGRMIIGAFLILLAILISETKMGFLKKDKMKTVG